MPIFQCKATDMGGNVICRTVAAASRKDAAEILFTEGLFPADIEQSREAETSASRPGFRITRSDIENFTRELASLLAAGLPLSRAIRTLCRESSKPSAKKLWSDIHDMVSNGMSLADAMRQRPRIFSSVYVAMIQAGEAGGFLDLVLEQIADFRGREQDLKGRVQSAMIYPVILSILAMLILLFLLTYFIPRFSSIFAEFGGSLPALTRGIVSTSGFILKYWPVVAGAVVLSVLGLRSFAGRQEGRKVLEQWLLKSPLAGKLCVRFAFVRFSRMLGTLLNAGVPLISALRVAREAIGNQTLAAAMDESIENVRKGVSLSQGLANCPQLFSGSNIEMISVAEESSRLGPELLRLAAVNEKELDRNLKTAVAFAEPVLLFLMAAFVGTIVIGMLLPVFNLQELIH